MMCIAVLLTVRAEWLEADSLMLGTYSVSEMGRPDYGGGSGHHRHAGRSVDGLILASDRQPDIRATLVARQATWRLDSGRRVEGYTINGTSPGLLM